MRKSKIEYDIALILKTKKIFELSIKVPKIKLNRREIFLKYNRKKGYLSFQTYIKKTFSTKKSESYKIIPLA
jgi:hypothetical protein